VQAAHARGPSTHVDTSRHIRRRGPRAGARCRTRGRLGLLRVRHLRVAGPGAFEQLLLSYAAGRLYYGFAGPWLRQHVEKAIGHDPKPAYVPPTTLGFLARDLFSTGLSFVVSQQAMRIIQGIGSAAGAAARDAPNLLVTSGGASGAAAGAGAGAFSLAALQRIAGTTLAMTVVATAVDAVVANKLGPKIEHAVGSAVGEDGTATVKSGKKDGTPPNNTVHTNAEQFARNFAHNALGSIAYSTVLGTVGTEAATLVAGVIPGAAGGLLGGIAAALVAGFAVSVEDKYVAMPVAGLLQDGVRTVERMLGRKVGAKHDEDVIPVPGDRVSWAIGGVFTPFATAALTGQTQGFLNSVMPKGLGH
jgi:hypothetical protein